MQAKGLCSRCMKRHAKDKCKVLTTECKKCHLVGHLEKCCAGIGNKTNKVEDEGTAEKGGAAGNSLLQLQWQQQQPTNSD